MILCDSHMTYPDTILLQECMELLLHLGMALPVPLVLQSSEIVEVELHQPSGEHRLLGAVL